VGFSGAEVTLEKDTPSLAVTESSQDGFKIAEDLPGDDEGF